MASRSTSTIASLGGSNSDVGGSWNVPRRGGALATGARSISRSGWVSTMRGAFARAEPRRCGGTRCRFRRGLRAFGLCGAGARHDHFGGFGLGSRRAVLLPPLFLGRFGAIARALLRRQLAFAPFDAGLVGTASASESGSAAKRATSGASGRREHESVELDGTRVPEGLRQCERGRARVLDRNPIAIVLGQVHENRVVRVTGFDARRPIAFGAAQGARFSPGHHRAGGTTTPGAGQRPRAGRACAGNFR